MFQISLARNITTVVDSSLICAVLQRHVNDLNPVHLATAELLFSGSSGTKENVFFGEGYGLLRLILQGIYDNFL